MRIDQVAAQLYTLREFTKTPADIARTLKKVREIGYPAVQVSAMGPIPESDLVDILAGEGLVCCATHEPGAMILDEPRKVVERLQKLGCRYTAYPYPGGIDMGDIDQVRRLGRGLDAAGRILREAGQTLLYHNHAIEFVRLEGELALDIILAEAAPENLKAEIDTYWVQAGGGDSAAWCRKLKGRLPVLHLKDYAFTKENTAAMAEIGSGNLDFKGIVAAAAESGCEWFVVEQDICRRDPFESLKMSFDYICEHLVDAAPAYAADAA